MKRFIIKLTLFVLLFLISLHFVSLIFVRGGNGYGTDVLSFYNEPKNSLDLIFFGSSHSYSTFSPKILEDELGLKSYNFSTQQQPLWITYYYMEEALKYQKPKYFVLDVLMTSVDGDYMSEGVNRDAIDKMKFSLTKINAINSSVESFYERLSYFFNIIKYHNRWSELNKSDITKIFPTNISETKGFTYLNGTVDSAVRHDYQGEDTDYLKISYKNEKYLKKIIKLAKDNDIELILVKSPCTMDDTMYKKFNYVSKIAKENNINFLNYNLIYDDINLDFSKDFYDSGHLNGNAAERMTVYFANYMKEKYNF